MSADELRFPVERRQVRRPVCLAELQEQFGFSERWWRYRLREDGFPVHRWGGRLRFYLDDVEDWLNTHDNKERSHHGSQEA
jgi:hypothetical protein